MIMEIKKVYNKEIHTPNTVMLGIYYSGIVAV